MKTKESRINQQNVEIKDKDEYELLLQAIKTNKLKRVDKRLQVIKLRFEGKTHQAIAEIVGYSREWVCLLIKDYKLKGLTEYSRHKYGGNNRAMSIEEETAILNKYKEASKDGKLVIATSIKKDFDEKRGKDTGRGYIYMLLKRHNAKKVEPRPAHPKKAIREVIEASKKN
jgi:transposase